MNKEWIPNSLTMANGLFGFLSIISSSQYKFTYASVFIILAMLADRYDGIVARKLDIVSAIGKQLDSLCDVISFGVAPAFLIFTKVSVTTSSSLLIFISTIVCGAYVCCGAYRLARFNVSTLSNGYYQGVPITTCGTILAFLSFNFLHIPIFALLLLTLICAYLMVSNIKIKKI